MSDMTQHLLHPLLAQRRSIRAFDPSAEVPEQEVWSLLEAARWAPSSWNSQPWRFVVARRGTSLHKRILAQLVEHNQRWAGSAALLLVGAHVTTSPSGERMHYGPYDLGQAIAHMSIQATALGLHVHQMAGFRRPGLQQELRLAENLQVQVVVAVGRIGSMNDLPADLQKREAAPRQRQPVTELLLPLDTPDDDA